MDFNLGNQPIPSQAPCRGLVKPQVGRGPSKKTRDPSVPENARAHAPPAPEVGRGGSGSSARKGSPRLTPPRSPERAFGTSLLPHRGLLGAGYRRLVPLSPPGPSLPSAEEPPLSPSITTSRFTRTPPICARRRSLLSPASSSSGAAGTNPGARDRGFRAKPAQ